MSLQINQLHDYLGYSAHHYPEKVAMTYDNQSLTYQEINQLTDYFAQNILSLGFKRGNRVVVCLGNSIETVLAFWGVLKAGGVISIISDDTKAEKIRYIINDSGCQFFISRSSVANKTFQSNTPFPLHLKNVIVTERCENLSSATGVCIDFDELLTRHDYPKKIDPNLDIDLAAIIYTSGSTGEPKGVMLTHRNMIAASSSINAYLGNTPDDVILSSLPLSFDYGLYQMIMAFSVSARLILEKDFLLPLRFIRKISEEKVTALPVVPTLLSILSETYKRFRFDTSSVRYITNTGAAIYDHHVAIIKTVFPSAQFYSMYGLTECKRCTYLPPQDIDRKRGSVGIAIPNTQMWVVDDNGKQLGPNQIGQLVIRGSTVMKGYWNRPEETAKKLKNGLLPAEQVLHTGDYGVIDEEGYFYFKGRMDEAIKSRGIKVSPKEIEEVINTIDGVKEAAVIGLPDAILGCEIVAFVACYPQTVIDEADIYSVCKQTLEKSKLPHRIILVPTLPKSPNGKLDKLSLRESMQTVLQDQEKVYA